MKKWSCLLLLMTMLACSNDKVEILTSEEKNELITKVLSKEKSAIEELDKIKKTLKEQSLDGNTIAEEELKKWSNLEFQKSIGTSFDDAKNFKF